MQRPGGRYAKPAGQMHVVTIGIDRYRSFNRLNNAVADARGAEKAFIDVGFQARTSLLDEAATRHALDRLVKEDLTKLNRDDSLVIFYAGHGCTEVRHLGGLSKNLGYLLPIDAEPSQTSTWLSINSWLSEINDLPPRHILVILDACHSGIALDPQLIWKGRGPRLPDPIERLRERTSRRIITSALGDQQAMDSGPTPGHSLFTGCLIEALSGGVGQEHGFATSSSISVYVQHRVATYAGSRQTPDFGALQNDDRGELVISLPWFVPKGQNNSSNEQRIIEDKSQRGTNVAIKRPPLPINNSRRTLRQPRVPVKLDPPTISASVPPPPPKKPPAPLPLRAGAGTTDPALSAGLDRHASQRERQKLVFSMISGETAPALAEMGTWSAQRGSVTLVTALDKPDLVVADLLSNMPLLRCLPGARARLAKAARIELTAVDASIDARAGRELHRWISSLAAGDPAVEVSGWLLAALRNKDAAPEVASAPLQGRKLLAALAAISAPISLAFAHQAPTEAWLDGVIGAAAELTRCLPRHPISVVAPSPLVTRVLTSRESSAISMARHGLVKLEKGSPASAHQRGPLSKTPDLNGAEAALHLALARDPRTRAARFEQRVMAPTHEREREVEVTLAAHAPRLIVELDSWYHLRDEAAYRDQRLKDLWLSRAGFFVMRFLVEDVERRLGEVIDEIALGLVGRR